MELPVSKFLHRFDENMLRLVASARVCNANPVQSGTNDNVPIPKDSHAYVRTTRLSVLFSASWKKRQKKKKKMRKMLKHAVSAQMHIRCSAQYSTDTCAERQVQSNEPWSTHIRVQRHEMRNICAGAVCGARWTDWRTFVRNKREIVWSRTADRASWLRDAVFVLFPSFLFSFLHLVHLVIVNPYERNMAKTFCFHFVHRCGRR